MAFPMTSATVSAISNNGSVKEYSTKFEKCPQAVSHTRITLLLNLTPIQFLQGSNRDNKRRPWQ